MAASISFLCTVHVLVTYVVVSLGVLVTCYYVSLGVFVTYYVVSLVGGHLDVTISVQMHMISIDSGTNG